ncbi:MAG TPA: tripartite tricarboxylate transporter permease [Paenirhodobacter sp.]
MIDNLLLAIAHVFHWQPLLAIVGGAFLGYAIGALPGVGPLLTIALLVPFTYGMDPATAIVGLISLYVAAEYGGAITAILMNTPGEAAAVATSWDGYPMAQRGEAEKALHISIISSGFGALLSSLLLIITAVPLAEFASRFGPSEYFMLAVLGLTLAAGLGGISPWRGLIAVALGLLVSTVGIDGISGYPRFSPSPMFYEGIPLVAALTGLYALSEVLVMVEDMARTQSKAQSVGSLLRFPLHIYRDLIGTMTRSSLIGFVIGVIPGAGAVIASLVAYHETVRVSKDPDSFGKGNPHGVAAAEAANNAAVPGAIAPLLALGIPGSSTAALLASALMIQGIQPGPLLFQKHPEVPYSIFVALIIGVPVMVLVGIVGVKFWAKITQVPKPMLAALITVTCCIGAWSTANDIYPVYITLAFGLIGWLLRKCGIPLGPLVLAYVLGNMLEENFRRSALIAQGDPLVFADRPITLILLALWLFAVFLAMRRRKPRPTTQAPLPR